MITLSGPVVVESILVFLAVTLVWFLPGWRLWKQIQQRGFEGVFLPNPE